MYNFKWNMIQLLSNESLLLTVKPSPRVSAVWLFTKTLSAALITIPFTWVLWSIYNSSPKEWGLSPYGFDVAVFVLFLVFVVTFLSAHAYYIFLARSYEYVITNSRFIFCGGLLRRVTHSVEHRRITDVQLSQNVIEQLLPLHSISLFTPSTVNALNYSSRPMPELRLEGLTNGDHIFDLVSRCIRTAKENEV